MTERQVIDVADALGESQLFGALLEVELAALVRLGTLVRYPAGQMIFTKGDPGDSLMIVLEGRIKIGSSTTDGREIVLSFIEAGQVLGEIALLDGKPRTMSATAAEPVLIFLLRRKAVLGFLEEKPSVAIRLIGVLVPEAPADDGDVRGEDAPQHGASGRTGPAALAAEHGRRTGEGLLIDLKLSQSEFGAFVGVSRENFTRQLGAWRDNGIVSLGGKWILIHELRDLEDPRGDPS